MYSNLELDDYDKVQILRRKLERAAGGKAFENIELEEDEEWLESKRRELKKTGVDKTVADSS
jgi:hypothetical protein